MEQIAIKLRKYLKGCPEINIVQNEYGAEIIDVRTNDLLGSVDLFDDDSFSGFDVEVMEMEEEEEATRTQLSEEQINQYLQTAEEFIADFITRRVKFGMFVEWGEAGYMIIYEEMDEKLGLSIPHTGCTIYMNEGGDITAAHLGQQTFTLEYPNISITKEEATTILRKSSIMKLTIDVEDDGNVELVYIANPEIMGVNLNGDVDTVSDFMEVEELPVHPIEKVTVFNDIESMLGITNDFFIFKDDGESKLWVEKEKIDQIDPDGEVEHSISFLENDTGHFTSSEVPWEETDHPLSEEQLQERAYQFLELIVGDIHEKYWIESSSDDATNDQDVFDENDLEEYEEMEREDVEFEEEWEDLYNPEPTKMFTFIRQHQGMRIEGYDAHIHVGKYTGIIRECSTTAVKTFGLNKLNLTPKITLAEAENRYFAEMDMQLIRSVKDFQVPSVYDVMYTINFPGEKGTIEKINAHTGEVTYVETGILREGN